MFIKAIFDLYNYKKSKYRIDVNLLHSKAKKYKKYSNTKKYDIVICVHKLIF